MTTDRYDIPADADVQQCSYCNRPFGEHERLVLHRGLEHPDQLDADEQTAFEAAYEAETEALRRYQIIAIGAIVLLYFTLLIIYALI